ncbi:MAG: hypothetical protein K0B81_02590 [Candidatus Cloacimonetes bacterium]|nr:hypothetical protein [Candidatus Cloacimonadota bacterium]
METRYIKDFTIAIIVIILFVFLLKTVNVVNTVQAVPVESRYKDMAIDAQLIDQIQQIEHSIRDRMDFLFTVTRDPLEQNLIVRTRIDLEQEWRRQVDAMIRLAATYIDENGNRRAAIAYGGETRLYAIGDSVNNNRIVDIDVGTVTLTYQGRESTLELKPIPPKPAQIDDRSRSQEYIW